MEIKQQFASTVPVRFLSTQSRENEVSLVPYSKVGEEWTLPDSLLTAVARQCERDGTFKTVFYEGHIKTPQEFLETMQKPANVPVFAFKGLDVIGFGWLNNIAGNRAFSHFCFLNRATSADKLEAGRMFVNYWFSFQGPNGGPLLDVLLGAIPVTNERAIQYTERLGCTRLGTIPRMIQDYYSGERVGAEIIYYVRSDHGEERRQ